jgi:hypothetical protein
LVGTYSCEPIGSSAFQHRHRTTSLYLYQKTSQSRSKYVFLVIFLSFSFFLCCCNYSFILTLSFVFFLFLFRKEAQGPATCSPRISPAPLHLPSLFPSNYRLRPGKRVGKCKTAANSYQNRPERHVRSAAIR